MVTPVEAGPYWPDVYCWRFWLLTGWSGWLRGFLRIRNGGWPRLGGPEWFGPARRAGANLVVRKGSDRNGGLARTRWSSRRGPGRNGAVGSGRTGPVRVSVHDITNRVGLNPNRSEGSTNGLCGAGAMGAGSAEERTIGWVDGGYGMRERSSMAAEDDVQRMVDWNGGGGGSGRRRRRTATDNGGRKAEDGRRMIYDGGGVDNWPSRTLLAEGMTLMASPCWTKRGKPQMNLISSL